MEDLWAFNEEVVARAIYDSEIPVISAVGHEPDVTSSDFVADLRAATPSNAAELAVPDRSEIAGILASQQKHMAGGMARRLGEYRQNLDRLAASRMMTSPAAYFQEKRLLLDYQSSRLGRTLERSIAGRKERLAKAAAALDAMSPLKVLARGYAIAQDEDGRVVASVNGVSGGDRLWVTLSDGKLECQVV